MAVVLSSKSRDTWTSKRRLVSVCSFRVDGKTRQVFGNSLGLGVSVLLAVFLTACNAAGSSAPTRVLIEWTTATEINTAGFNLYRSESATGPYTKINAQLIPASPNALVGGKYRYEDATVESGQTYYYQLEDVGFNGATTQHGPIVVTAPSAFGVSDVILILLELGVIVAAGIGASYIYHRALGKLKDV